MFDCSQCIQETRVDILTCSHAHQDVVHTQRDAEDDPDAAYESLPPHGTALIAIQQASAVEDNAGHQQHSTHDGEAGVVCIQPHLPQPFGGILLFPPHGGRLRI
eukprot:TRINITY_DN14668_c0_g1_i1.p1 TRINITY_DN14668_c0_g1~~TRINITY_DN14668_c0_g1_i1.p1  ORF type:complete len:104 (+),score=5.13 TRINITY_DN14668_c0_g1_i1:28-339(+)